MDGMDAAARRSVYDLNSSDSESDDAYDAVAQAEAVEVFDPYGEAGHTQPLSDDEDGGTADQLSSVGEGKAKSVRP